MSITRFFGFFLSWWGVVVLAALDSSLFFFVPFGNDGLVIYMAARDQQLFWVYPFLATAGSVAGAAVTYWIGRKIGAVGLTRFVPQRRLERLKRRLQGSGGFAFALPAVLPPPFPLTAFVLTSGALDLSWRQFFAVFAGARILRFGAEAVLAQRYGRGVLDVMESRPFQLAVIGFVVLAIAGTAVSIVAVWRRTRSEP